MNLQPDSSWGTNGTFKITDIAAGTTSLNYGFVYTLKDEEVDKLVGFNYRIEDSKGKAAEKDLTVNTIASGAQIIASHPWKIISVIWETDDPPSETFRTARRRLMDLSPRQHYRHQLWRVWLPLRWVQYFLTNGHSAKMKNIHPHLPFCIRCNKSYYRSLYGKTLTKDKMVIEIALT